MLLLGLGSSSTGSLVWTALCNLVTWALQYNAYVGILEQAANSAGSTSSSSDLVGGVHLDLLALTVAVQYLSVLHSSRWFYLLAAVPIYAFWNLYKMYKGVGGGGMVGTPGAATTTTTIHEVGGGTSETNQQKREKRAKKRANKFN